MEKVNSTLDISAREFIVAAISIYIESNFSFSLWRCPHSSTIYLAATDKPQLLSEISIEEIAPGFLFSPFDPSKEKIHLAADELYSFESDQIIISKGNKTEEIIKRRNDKKSNSIPYLNTKKPSSITKEDHYHQLVAKCIEEIGKGTFEKVVPSRFKTVELPEGFNFIHTFNLLCELYPYAMVSIFSSPITGTWIGATPEMLVGIKNDQHFYTAAIAGTQPYLEGMDLRSISWNQKEIEEQALVERYIISCFKKIRLREYDEHGPKTIVAGNVLHLKTDFTVDMIATNFPLLGSTMLKLLHPTSAVCGMPLENSLKFLKENEGYDREFYSGYLGPVNINNETSVYVNLRCMQLFANEATLYAGAGVMADSDPEKEWRETEMKMNTLGKIVGK
ncbi:MAG: chorismate-binding protein [Cyclobacteriaceae bacterium]|nr:chorismate-binding protein [Cyclobacteriaceae bacterium]